MTVETFRAFLSDNELENRWWIAVDGHVIDHTYSLDEIEAQFTNRQIALLHYTKLDTNNPVWIPVDWAEQVEDESEDEANSAFLDGVPPAVKRQFTKIDDDLSSLRNNMEDVVSFLGDLRALLRDKQMVRQKVAELEKRERFLDESESKLMKKIQALEEREATFLNKQEVAEGKTTKNKMFKVV